MIVFRPNQHIENIALFGSRRGTQFLCGGAIHPGARRPVWSRRKRTWGRQWDADDLGEVGGQRLLVGGVQLQKRTIEAAAIEILALLRLGGGLARDHSAANEGLGDFGQGHGG